MIIIVIKIETTHHDSKNLQKKKLIYIYMQTMLIQYTLINKKSDIRIYTTDIGTIYMYIQILKNDKKFNLYMR